MTATIVITSVAMGIAFAYVCVSYVLPPCDLCLFVLSLSVLSHLVLSWSLSPRLVLLLSMPISAFYVLHGFLLRLVHFVLWSFMFLFLCFLFHCRISCSVALHDIYVRSITFLFVLICRILRSVAFLCFIPTLCRNEYFPD